MGLTSAQVDTLITIERVTACVSVIATLCLITTFIFLKSFRTLSNTLIFYASFANLFANVAALIGGSALSKTSSRLCQFQGFLLEMFMQSDPMWSLAMAVNVYLVFFRRYDATRLKRLYWVYGIICYGIPFIPAMVCLLYKNQKGEIYGNATLWCWIDSSWAPLRIYSYYAPIWVCILAAIIIYVRVGIEIFQKRSELRAMGGNVSGTLTSSNAPPEPSFTGIRTTEVEVTHDDWNKNGLASPTTPALTYNRSAKGNRDPNLYSITISAQEATSSFPQSARFATNPMPKRASSMDKVKWAYTKVSMLFAVSILITWVPASVNRVYGLRYPEDPSFILNIGSALVLPLQGFWNTVIYFTTSLTICKGVWSRLRSRTRKEADSLILETVLSGRRARDKETESTEEFSTSRSEHSLGDSF